MIVVLEEWRWKEITTTTHHHTHVLVKDQSTQ